MILALCKSKFLVSGFVERSYTGYMRDIKVILYSKEFITFGKKLEYIT